MHVGRLIWCAVCVAATTVGLSAPVAADPPPGCDPAVPTTCTIAQLADLLDFRFGATIEDFETTDADYTTTLLREFNSVTPENALKMYTIQPTRGGWQWGPADTVVDFALDNGLEFRSHVLVWSQDQYTPAWVRAISDPVELREVLDEYVTEVLQRYGDRLGRWDVVNEPLATFGTGNSESVFWTLGQEWIGDVFRLARTLAPDAELWINEYGTDWVPGKHEAFLALVRSLVEAGVPIDGVGIQTHRIPNLRLDRATFERQLRDFTALGLEVAITELDVPVPPLDPQALTWQATEYRTAVAACLAVVGCNEVTTWGVTDRYTWLDSLGLFDMPTRPLLFDDDYRPKPAYDAVRALLAEAVLALSAPGPDPSDTTVPVATTPVTAPGVLPATGGRAGDGQLTVMATAFFAAGALVMWSVRRRRPDHR
jgi:endo-1,4-beta-xylanase